MQLPQENCLQVWTSLKSVSTTYFRLPINENRLRHKVNRYWNIWVAWVLVNSIETFDRNRLKNGRQIECLHIGSRPLTQVIPIWLYLLILSKSWLPVFQHMVALLWPSVSKMLNFSSFLNLTIFDNISDGSWFVERWNLYLIFMKSIASNLIKKWREFNCCFSFKK